MVLLSALLLLAILYATTWSSHQDSHFATLYVEGKKRYILDLREEKTLAVEGRKGLSKLEIKGGKVRFIASPCRTHFCIRSGWLNPNIGVIACLPNGVSLHLSNQNKTFDAINF